MPGATSAKFFTTPELGDGGPLSSTVLVPLLTASCEDFVFEAIRCLWVETILAWLSGSMLILVAGRFSYNAYNA